MTDNDIKKGLANMTYGSHYCAKCKYDNGKGDDRCGLKGCKISRYALDLINRLEAENEKLKNSLAISEKETKRYVQGYKMACSERNEFLGQLETAKAEAYKEFAERLKEKGNRSLGDCFIVGWIDNLLKEMVGEDNG